MQLFRYANGRLPNCAVLAYIVMGYPSALVGLATTSGVVWVISCLLLAHTLIISAYLLHDCIHNTIFRNSRHNRLLGMTLAWLTGAAYTPYSILERKHLRHHADRVDVLAIDYLQFLNNHPALQRGLALLQDWHLPAVEILTHGLSMLAPLILPSRRDQRSYVLLILLSRVSFFTLLALVNPVILPAYLLGWLLMITVLGFMDTFQHHYEIRLLLEDDKVLREYDRDYEETHTFSNLLSTRHPVLNLLVLNFCYHNMHHYRSGIPWHDLPRAHAERYKDHPAPIVSFGDQLVRYHRYRRQRLNGITNAHTGAAGVSFLVGV